RSSDLAASPQGAAALSLSAALALGHPVEPSAHRTLELAHAQGLRGGAARSPRASGLLSLDHVPHLAGGAHAERAAAAVREQPRPHALARGGRQKGADRRGG